MISARELVLILLLGFTTACGGGPNDSISPTTGADGPRAWDIAFVSDRTGTSRLHRLNPDTGAVSLLETGVAGGYGARWLDSRGRLVFAHEIDGRSLLFEYEPGGGTAEELFDNPGRDEVPDWMSDGETFVVSTGPEGSRHLAIGTRGGTLEAITSGEADDKQPRLSPDSGRLLLVSDRSGNQDIFLLELASGELVNLTDHPALEGHPVWAPDGASLLFYRYEDGDADIYTIGVDGGDARNLTRSEGNELVATYSPDGEWIAVGSARDDDWEIYRMRPDGSEVERLTQREGFDGDPVWIPRR